MYVAGMNDGPPPEGVTLHKVTVNLIPKAWDAVTATSERLGLTKTDTINRALQAYEFLEREAAEGSEVLIRRKDGKVEQVKFL